MPIKNLVNEAEILGKIAQGDHLAFCILFDHYHQYVFGFGRKLTRSNNQAEEIVQDIFLKIWEGRGRLTGLDNFEAYLTRLVKNQAFSVLRRNTVRTKAAVEIALTATEQDYSMESEMEYNETVKILNEAILSLPQQQRKVYELCHQQGLKYDEVAAQMNISPDTVHYHMKLALKAIREHFRNNAFTYHLLLACLFRK